MYLRHTIKNADVALLTAQRNREMVGTIAAFVGYRLVEHL
jgi:hypothetical protein